MQDRQFKIFEIDYRGGIVFIPQSDISLYIPKNAVPEGTKCRLALGWSTNREDVPFTFLKSGASPASDLIVALPHGRWFQKQVMLVFPLKSITIHKTIDQNHTRSRILCCDGPVKSPDDWYDISKVTEQKENQGCLNDTHGLLLLKHLCFHQVINDPITGESMEITGRRVVVLANYVQRQSREEVKLSVYIVKDKISEIEVNILIWHLKHLCISLSQMIL